MPKVSVCLLTYNRANFLRESIKSILSQTFKDFELLILNNASTDHTEEVVNEFVDERIRYIRNETNVGVYRNVLKGIQLSKGEYIITFCDDDMMKPELLEKEVNVLDDHPDFILVSADMSYINETGKFLQEKVLNLASNMVFEQYRFIESHFMDDIYIFFPTVMLRKTVIDEKKMLYKEEVGPACDTFFWLELNTLPEKLYIIAEPLIWYRLHNQQQSRIENTAYSMEIQLYRYAYELVEKNGLNHILPFIRRRRDERLERLIEQVVSNKLPKDEFSRIISKEPFWTRELKPKYLLRIFMCINFPRILKWIYKR